MGVWAIGQQQICHSCMDLVDSSYRANPTRCIQAVFQVCHFWRDLQLLRPRHLCAHMQACVHACVCACERACMCGSVTNICQELPPCRSVLP